MSSKKVQFCWPKSKINGLDFQCFDNVYEMTPSWEMNFMTPMPKSQIYANFDILGLYWEV